MDLELRPITPEEFGDLVAVMGNAFGFDVHADDIEMWESSFEYERSLCAFEAGLMVGTAGAVSFEMTVPGGTVPTAGVTMVSVLPTHRRRGVLRQMMRKQLEDIRARGEPAAALWASESLIYGRFGYGMAVKNAEWTIDRAHARIAHSSVPAGHVRLVRVEEARKILPDLYEGLRPHIPGFLSWGDPSWEFMWHDPEHRRDGGSTRRFAVYEERGKAEGAVVYRQHSKWADGFGAGRVAVRLLLAGSVSAYEALWSHCFGIDLVQTIEASFRPPDEPLAWMLADARRLRVSSTDGLWVRILDVPAALGSRRYSYEGSLVLGVKDDFLPDLSGRYLLEGGPQGATCVRTTKPADLVLDVQALGSIYLGASHLSGLERAGRVKGEPAAISKADAMFRGHREPWSPMMF